MTCPDCHGTGIKTLRQHYVWGMYVMAPCDCGAGRQEAQRIEDAQRVRADRVLASVKEEKP